MLDGGRGIFALRPGIGALKEHAGHLPGLSNDEVEWETLAFGESRDRLEVAVPVLSDAQLEQVIGRVKTTRRDYLSALPVTEIIDKIDQAIGHLLDRNNPLRQKAEELLPIVTGFDPETVRLGLTSYLKTFRKPQLQRFLAEDFANPQMLDAFQPVSKGGFARAYGHDLVAQIWAGNVPGLPIWSIVSGLLVKSGCVGKVASAEPLFAGWFAETLAEVDPKLADCIAILWWKGGDQAREDAVLSRADAVIAYGNNETLAQIRSRVPVTTRYLPFGHKISFAMVGRSALDTRNALSVAREAAHDVVRYDQQGCYSPQAIIVERGGAVSPKDFAAYLGNDLASLEHRFPRRSLSLPEAAGVAEWTQRERVKSVSAPDMEVTSDTGGRWSVVYAEDERALGPSSLNRTVKVMAVDRLDEMMPAIEAIRPYLQTVGIAADPNEMFRLSGLLGQAGATRICALGQMASPEAGWHHDGRFNLLDLVYVVDIDQSAEAAAEGFAPYAD